MPSKTTKILGIASGYVIVQRADGKFIKREGNVAIRYNNPGAILNTRGTPPYRSPTLGSMDYNSTKPKVQQWTINETPNTYGTFWLYFDSWSKGKAAIIQNLNNPTYTNLNTRNAIRTWWLGSVSENQLQKTNEGIAKIATLDKVVQLLEREDRANNIPSISASTTIGGLTDRQKAKFSAVIECIEAGYPLNLDSVRVIMKHPLNSVNPPNLTVVTGVTLKETEIPEANLQAELGRIPESEEVVDATTRASDTATDIQGYWEKYYIEALKNNKFEALAAALQNPTNASKFSVPPASGETARVPFKEVLKRGSDNSGAPDVLVSNAQLRPELNVLNNLTGAASQASATIGNISQALSGLTPFEQAIVLLNNYLELSPDRMRNKMSANTGGTNPNYSHAWRAPGKLAITATLTIPGAAGFRIGQIFRVGRTYNYNRYGAFQLFGLTENIDISKGWTTQLYSRFNAMPTEKIADAESV